MKNKNILITGASKGIGKAIKIVLEEKGFNCIAPTRSELDISNLASIESYFSSLEVEVAGLVNNAGINIIGDIDAINDSDTEKMINANLIAPLKIIQFVVKDMKRRGCGRIVNVSSIWGVRSKEFRTLYSLTKFGLNGVTKSLARELGPNNILINSIAPGYVNTEMTSQNVPDSIRKKIEEDIPLGRFAEPLEIANLVAFLLSDENTYITGQTMTIDGGFLA
ncbi:SDR family NAD(P)-dependent oxidoreductase [Pseudomonadota bacterium]